MRALRPRTVSTPDGRKLVLRFEPLGSTWHASAGPGEESDGLDLPEAVALATGDSPDTPWIIELERELDPEYARARTQARGRGAHASTR